MKLLSELDSLDNVKDGSIRKLPTKTSDLTNDSGFIDNSNAMDLTTSQTANGAKTFGDNLTLSKKLFVGTMQTIYNASEESSNFLGSLFFGDGGGLLSHITSIEGYGDTGIGINSLYNNTTGYENTGVGLFSLYNNTTGYYNTGIGSRAGHTIANGTTGNMTPSNSVYIGAYTKALADNQTNQIVIGYDTTGHGSNTATIGNTSITDNYFNGNLHLTGALKNATNTFTLPSSTGTFALTSDIPSVSDFLVASNIKAGTNITLSVSGKDVTINSTGGAAVTVVDNLTSTSTTSALSANQGKVLNDNKVPNTRTVAGKALSANITLASTDLTDTANIARLAAPTNIAGTEQATAKFMTSNGGSLTLGKEGPNSGTMLRLDQVDGTPRLRFRSSATAGAMVWSQLEANAALYMDLADSAGVTKRITFNALQLSHPVKLYAPTVQTTTLTNGTYNYTLPSATGTLALTSQIPNTSNFVTLSGPQTLSNKTLTANLSSPLSTKSLTGTLYVEGTSYGNITFTTRGEEFYQSPISILYRCDAYCNISNIGNRFNDVDDISLRNITVSGYSTVEVFNCTEISQMGTSRDWNERGIYYHSTGLGGAIGGNSIYANAAVPNGDWALNEASYIKITGLLLRLTF